MLYCGSIFFNFNYLGWNSRCPNQIYHLLTLKYFFVCGSLQLSFKQLQWTTCAIAKHHGSLVTKQNFASWRL